MAFVQGHCFSNHSLYSAKTSEFRARKSSFKNGIRCEHGDSAEFEKGLETKKWRKLRILIAGGGVGGLVLALAAKKSGFDVKVFEKNLSAVRGEGRHRGPIQLQSNALAVLEAIDKDVVNKIIEAGCVTGDRTNGLADGLSGNWYVPFKLHPNICNYHKVFRKKNLTFMMYVAGSMIALMNIFIRSSI
eukprot:TRINITY_DN2946_c0_g1_i3.p1 TRINITY_DN2946_c0_g1~~TRINITY_DN2946_c0_g1_i3.p1  ORF type:complete len:188 (-),score=25.50 TRINITY_DN2946_c0_g1_i3:529-1092(-)